METAIRARRLPCDGVVNAAETLGPHRKCDGEDPGDNKYSVANTDTSGCVAVAETGDFAGHDGDDDGVAKEQSQHEPTLQSKRRVDKRRCSSLGLARHGAD